MFDVLKTGIDGLDAILGGGIRYPAGGAAFVFVTGGAGSGKTVLALELAARAWLDVDDGSTCLYYSVEHTPRSLYRKLSHDFAFYGSEAEIERLPQEVPHKLVLEARQEGRRSRLVITQANPASLESAQTGSSVDIDWILAEIGNHGLAGRVKVACVDNISLLLTDLDYYQKRRALLATRRQLMDSGVHGIFVQETTSPGDLRMPSAEEFSTDLLIELSFQTQHEQFKARTIEIAKARHQYYYRGAHHFSIAGRGIRRDTYLGARSERGPGLHIYPSVAAQLSIARDSHSGKLPPRGHDVIDLGHPDLVTAYTDGSGPTSGSSIAVLAEPGTRYTFLALRFLASGCRAGQQTLMVSTKEDQDALVRIMSREPPLRECLGKDGQPIDRFRLLYLHPEFISAGKFIGDLLNFTESYDGGPAVTRVAFDNMYRLEDRFPLLAGQTFMIPALLDMLRYRGVTPMFMGLVPPGSGDGKPPFDPGPYLMTFDHVFHLFLRDVGDTQQPFVRILKSPATAFSRRAMPLDFAKT